MADILKLILEYSGNNPVLLGLTIAIVVMLFFMYKQIYNHIPSEIQNVRGEIQNVRDEIQNVNDKMDRRFEDTNNKIDNLITFLMNQNKKEEA